MSVKNDYLSLKAYKKSYAYKHVFSAIKEGIISGTLKPGDRLPSETELSLRLDIGRSAVREGLRELEAVGLIRTVTGKKGGRFVNRVSPDFIVEGLGLVLQLNNVSFNQFMDARKVIESAAAEMAAQQRTKADLEEMKQALNCMRDNLFTKELFFEGNYAFHRAMVSASHNTVLAFIIQALRKLVFNYFDLFTMEKIEIDTPYVYELHRLIYGAVKDQDPVRAKEMTIKDLDDFCANYHRYYRDQN